MASSSDGENRIPNSAGISFQLQTHPRSGAVLLSGDLSPSPASKARGQNEVVREKSSPGKRGKGLMLSLLGRRRRQCPVSTGCSGSRGPRGCACGVSRPAAPRRVSRHFPRGFSRSSRVQPWLRTPPDFRVLVLQLMLQPTSEGSPLIVFAGSPDEGRNDAI